MTVDEHTLTKPENESLIKALGFYLADTFTLYIKSLNHHWNVKGPLFLTLHQFFEDQYIALAEASDLIAERIRQLGADSPASMSEFMKMTKVEETTGKLTATQMIDSLLKAHQISVQSCTTALAAAEHDDVTTDLLTDRKTFHDKSIWMLTSLQEK